MAADFEEESRLATETITRQGSNPNVTMGVITGAILIGRAWGRVVGVVRGKKQAAKRARGSI